MRAVPVVDPRRTVALGLAPAFLLDAVRDQAVAEHAAAGDGDVLDVGVHGGVDDLGLALPLRER